MSVRSFHSVFMATAVAGAALGCYLVSLRVASERAALENVEAKIIATQADIRLLQTEIGTRGRLSQLERWNVRALALSAPSADQILGDKFQLARLVRPEPKFQAEAPVVLAAAPAPPPDQPLADDGDADVAATTAPELLHEASLKVEPRDEPPGRTVANAQPKASPPKLATIEKAVASADKKAGEKTSKSPTSPVTKAVRTAKVDPLAPLPAPTSSAKGLRSER